MVKDSEAPVIGAVREAHRTGKGAPSLMAQSIRELLPQPLDAVRARLRIPQPVLYHECHRIWRVEGIDPYDMLATRPAEQELLAA
jgi:ubiquinone biosynthesis protein COQ4